MGKVFASFNWPGLVFIIAVIGVWEALVGLEVIDFDNVPAPSEVTSALGDLISEGALLEPMLHTLKVVAISSTLALATGLIVGSALGLSPGFATWFMASVDFLRTIPVVALLPVAVLLWGPSTRSELIVTAYAASWVMVVNTAGGFRSVHPRLTDVSRTLRLSRTATFRKIWLPALTPALLVGARLSVVSAVLTAIIAETFVNPAGLGWEIMRSQQALRPGELWTFAIVGGFLGYLLNLVLIATVRFGTPGGRDNPALIGA